MSPNDQPANGGSQTLKVKVTLELFDSHAPGIIEFLRSLPARAETAFIRGLIYQWMLESLGTDDYPERLLAVLNGPGGRAMFSLPNYSAHPTKQVPSAPSKMPRKRSGAGVRTTSAPIANAAALTHVPHAFPTSQDRPDQAIPSPVQGSGSRNPPAEPAASRAAPIAGPLAPESDMSNTPVDPDVELNPFDELF